mgnify:CR=1 FL=1
MGGLWGPPNPQPLVLCIRHPTATVSGGRHFSTSARQTAPSTLNRSLPPASVAVARSSLPPDPVAVGKGSDLEKKSDGSDWLQDVKRVKTVNLGVIGGTWAPFPV